MYYRLTVNQENENAFVRGVSHNEILLTAGRLITRPITEPFRFEMEVSAPDYQFDPDYEGPPPEGPPWDPNLFDYYSNACVMHQRLVKALRTVGVENVQSFPAIIERPETGDAFGDYLAINVVGLVSCANLEASESDPLGDSHFFHKLVIDSARTHGQMLFRLAEYPPEILVDERVAKELEDGGFRGLALDPVTEA